MRGRSQGAPIIFSRRWTREGGEAIDVSEPQGLAPYAAVCRAGRVDFQGTPTAPAGVARLIAMERAGADIAKAQSCFEDRRSC